MVRRGGNQRAQSPATARVASPPTTTEGTSPHQAAVTPDSSSPSSLEAPINIAFTALTRPRSASGVCSCTSMWRTNTLTMSAAPSTVSTARESEKLVDTPKVIVASPKMTTPPNIAAPARSVIGRTVSQAAVTAAPTPGAARSRPRPSGPTCRISLAYAGRSAVAPPKRTAKRSIEIAPRMTGRERTKPSPSSTVRQLAGSRSDDRLGTATLAISRQATTRSAAQVPYTTSGPARYNTPPRAGPAIVATCQVDELTATAWPKSTDGTRFGMRDCCAGAAKARAAPNSDITASTGHGSVKP